MTFHLFWIDHFLMLKILGLGDLKFSRYSFGWSICLSKSMEIIEWLGSCWLILLCWKVSNSSDSTFWVSLYVESQCEKSWGVLLQHFNRLQLVSAFYILAIFCWVVKVRYVIFSAFDKSFSPLKYIRNTSHRHQWMQQFNWSEKSLIR